MEEGFEQIQMKNECITEIIVLLRQCADFELLDFILQMLRKTCLRE